MNWTLADQAEADALTWALVADYHEHRRRRQACQPGPCPELEAWLAHEDECPACQGIAPLTFGPPCADWRARRMQQCATRVSREAPRSQC